MIEVASKDFIRDFATMARRAQKEPVKVKAQGRTEGYFISAEAFERFEGFMNNSTVAYHPSELPGHLLEALTRARMDPADEALNGLLD